MNLFEEPLDDTWMHEVVAELRAENERLTALNGRLIALLEELIDIEGPQPGTIEWASKVRAVLISAGSAPSHDDRRRVEDNLGRHHRISQQPDSRNQHTELREAIARQQAENNELRIEIERLRADVAALSKTLNGIAK